MKALAITIFRVILAALLPDPPPPPPAPAEERPEGESSKDRLARLAREFIAERSRPIPDANRSRAIASITDMLPVYSGPSGSPSCRRLLFCGRDIGGHHDREVMSESLGYLRAALDRTLPPMDEWHKTSWPEWVDKTIAIDDGKLLIGGVVVGQAHTETEDPPGLPGDAKKWISDVLAACMPWDLFRWVTDGLGHGIDSEGTLFAPASPLFAQSHIEAIRVGISREALIENLETLMKQSTLRSVGSDDLRKDGWCHAPVAKAVTLWKSRDQAIRALVEMTAVESLPEEQSVTPMLRNRRSEVRFLSGVVLAVCVNDAWEDAGTDGAALQERLVAWLSERMPPGPISVNVCQFYLAEEDPRWAALLVLQLPKVRASNRDPSRLREELYAKCRSDRARAMSLYGACDVVFDLDKSGNATVTVREEP